MKTLQAMVNELIALGFSQGQIASVAGTSQPTIGRIANGSQNTSYEIGKKIEAYYQELVSGAAPANDSFINNDAA